MTWCVSVEFASNLIKESALSWSQWLQTAGDSPEGPLFQNPIRQNSEQYYLCVCVYIYYIANEQIAAMWRGLVAWQQKKKRKEKNTHSLRAHTPVTSHRFPSFHHNTHTPNHKAPSVPDQSVHQLMRSAGLGVLIITLLSGGLTKAYSHHTHTLAHNRVGAGRVLW